MEQKRKPPGELLTSIGWLARQPRDFQAELLKRGHIEKFPRDTFFFHLGDEPGGVYGIIDGSVGVLLPTSDSVVRLAEILRPGVWFGNGPLLTKGVRTLTFQAREAVTAMHVELGHLHEVGARSTDFMRILGSIGSVGAEIAIRTIQDLLIPQTERRIAATLLRVTGSASNFGPARTREVQLNQAELAEMANTSRHTVSRTLNLFENAGWIVVSYKNIRIQNSEKLAAFTISGNRAFDQIITAPRRAVKPRRR